MALFDEMAKSYDGWYETKMGGFADKVQTDLAFRLFPIQAGQRILDVGCGTGNFCLKLAKAGCRVTGVDVSAAMLAIARDKAARAGADITFREMDAGRLSFPDGAFDGAISMAAFEFIKEPVQALHEMLRVVKRGGCVLIGAINKESAWGRLYLSEAYQRDTIFRHADLKTLAEMRNWRGDLLAGTGECLFVPPDAPEEDFRPEMERSLAKTERGGFICALWKT